MRPALLSVPACVAAPHHALRFCRATPRAALRSHAPPQPRATRLGFATRVRRGLPCSAAGDGEKRPQDDPLYTSRLFKLEADPDPSRNNITSNLKLAGGVTALLAALVYGFLASNGLV